MIKRLLEDCDVFLIFLSCLGIFFEFSFRVMSIAAIIDLL